MIRARSIEESINASQIIIELSKEMSLFEYILSSEVIDKIALGLESDSTYTVRSTLQLLN